MPTKHRELNKGELEEVLCDALNVISYIDKLASQYFKTGELGDTITCISDRILAQQIEWAHQGFNPWNIDITPKPLPDPRLDQREDQ